MEQRLASGSVGPGARVVFGDPARTIGGRADGGGSRGSIALVEDHRGASDTLRLALASAGLRAASWSPEAMVDAVRARAKVADTVVLDVDLGALDGATSSRATSPREPLSWSARASMLSTGWANAWPLARSASCARAISSTI